MEKNMETTSVLGFRVLGFFGLEVPELFVCLS